MRERKLCGARRGTDAETFTRGLGAERCNSPGGAKPLTFGQLRPQASPSGLKKPLQVDDLALLLKGLVRRFQHPHNT